jgi:hypothetical protein
VTDISLITDIANIRKNGLQMLQRKLLMGNRRFQGYRGVKRLLREYGTHLITKADLEVD